jgi:5-formyltetrahydrofolate cyclo-ligase
MIHNYFRKLRHRLKKLFRNKLSGKPVVIEKARIREEIKRLKFRMTLEEKIHQADLVFKKIESFPEFQRADKILMYWSMPDELPTHEFIKKWSESKTILLPVVKGDKMTIRTFTSESDLKQGKWKTMEPASFFHSHEIADLVIVPGIAFDKNKQRLGRGGGYYDRYFKHKEIPRWGIGFSFQLYDSIPTASFDIQMDKIITPDHLVE